jgi:hypothetical protein
LISVVDFPADKAGLSVTAHRVQSIHSGMNLSWRPFHLSASNDVDVQVVDRLSTVWTVVDDQAEPYKQNDDIK